YHPHCAMDNLKRMPSYDTLKRHFEDEEEAISFLYQHSAVYKERNCPKCGRRMILKMEKRTYRCSKDTCKHHISLFKNSFFYRHRIPCCKVLQLAYYWLCGMKSTTAVSLSGLTKTP